MYERATRCGSDRGGTELRRRYIAAALTCLRLASPKHAFLARPHTKGQNVAPQVQKPPILLVRSGSREIIKYLKLGGLDERL